MDKRKYQQSHPWLSFSFDTSRFQLPVWMYLGAAQSKCRHIEGMPLDEEHAQALYKFYLARGAMATTAIEGNTLSEQEVMAILDGKSKIPSSWQYLEQEVRNILKAFDDIFDAPVFNNAPELTVEKLCHLNELVLAGLELEDGVVAGQIRQHGVTVGRYHGAPAEDCPYLLQKLCDTLNGPGFTLGDKWGYATGILKGIIAHLYLAWIHPFGDGNGRTARLAEMMFFAAAGIPKPACHVLSDFYNKTRDKYYLELDKASRISGVESFLLYALEGLVDMLDEQISHIRDYQMETIWVNLVHKTLSENTPATERRRYLALDLYKYAGKGIPKNKIREISPRLAAGYAGVTSRTINRDINALEAQKLVLLKDGRLYPDQRKILAWLPVRRKGTNMIS